VIGTDYPAPVVDHAKARERTLARFAVVKGAAAESEGEA
jgi:deoxyribodipyrimidine photo-lyase